MSNTAVTIRRNEQVSANLVRMAEHRELVLSNEVVQGGLNDVEFKVAHAAIMTGELSRRPIKAISDKELANEISDTLGFIIRDLGIKNWNGDDAAYDASRFKKLLRGYYGHLTYKEVELSFELLSVGKLDDYLPKDKSGKADKNHYQSFSVEFVTKVLNAFSTYKQKVWSKANSLLPERAESLSEEAIKEANDAFINSIYLEFDRYKNQVKEASKIKGGIVEPPKFPADFMVVEQLIKAGLLDGEPEITEADKRLAMVSFLSNSFKSTYEKKVVKTQWNEEKDSHYLKGYYPLHARKRSIRKVFDRLIKQKKDIRDFVKNTQ